MATIVTRTGKGSALTVAELDANFTNLNNAKLESGTNITIASSVTASGAAVDVDLQLIPKGVGVVDVVGDLRVSGGDLVTSQTTASVFNATATTLNIGGAATTVSLGAATGTTTVNNNIKAKGYYDATNRQLLIKNEAGTVVWGS